MVRLTNFFLPSNAYKNANLWKGNLNVYFKQILNGTNVSAKHVVTCTNWVQNETQTYLTGLKTLEQSICSPNLLNRKKIKLSVSFLIQNSDSFGISSFNWKFILKVFWILCDCLARSLTPYREPWSSLELCCRQTAVMTLEKIWDIFSQRND